jgi:hypothetical protein
MAVAAQVPVEQLGGIVFLDSRVIELLRRPCARAVSIAHTETPSEILETVKWGRRRGSADDPVPAATAG